MLPLSVPYIIFITNTIVGPPTDVVLFGQSRNYLLPNLGNPIGITVSMSSGISYEQMLVQSSSQPFDIGQWKISSTNTAQLDNEVLVEYFDANRRACNDPIDVNKDPYQFAQDQVVYWYPVKIDGNTQLRFSMLSAAVLPNPPFILPTTVVLKLYPSQIIIPSRPLTGGSQIKNLAIPKISGLNAPTIIARLR